MLSLRYRIPAMLARDPSQLPDALSHRLSLGVERAAMEVAREEKNQAPKAFSTLANSIKAEKTGEFAWEVSPHVEHADYIAKGTHPGAFPPSESIVAWIRVMHIEPYTKGVDERALAFLIGRSIKRRGIKSNPFDERTVEKMQPRFMQIIRGALAAGMREARLA